FGRAPIGLPALCSLIALACGSGSSSDNGGSRDGGGTDGEGPPDSGAGTSSSGSSSGLGAEGGSSGGSGGGGSGGSSGGSSSSGVSGDGGGSLGADGGYVLPSGRSYPDTNATIALLVDQLPTMSTQQMQFATSHFVGTEKQLLSVTKQLRAYNPQFLVLHYHLAMWQS